MIKRKNYLFFKKIINWKSNFNIKANKMIKFSSTLNSK